MTTDSHRAIEAYLVQYSNEGALEFASECGAYSAGYLAALAELAKACGFNSNGAWNGNIFDCTAQAVRQRSAPVCPPPPPPTREQQIAMREGEHWACSDPYFKARPELDDTKGRRVFEAGFTRGYDAAQGL